MVRQAPWVQIKGSVGPTGGSFSLDTITRPQPILTTPAENRVMVLEATAPVIEQLRALPAWTDLLPPLTNRTVGFEENDYLRRTFAVDFLRRYLTIAQQAAYQPLAFDDVFAALTTILIDRSVEERVLIPLESVTWDCAAETIDLDETTRLRLLTDEDREQLLNTNRDPIFGSGRDAHSFLWVRAGVDSAWRVPLHATRLTPERFQGAFDAITALRLASPGLVSAPMGYAVSSYAGAFRSVRTSQPLPFRATTTARPYILTEERVVAVREAFGALRSLSPADRKKIDLALERFNRSFDVPRPEERVVDLMIALDSVLGEKGPSSAYKLGIRLPLYIANERSVRSHLQDLVRDAYDRRSAIVHGGRAARRPTVELSVLLEELEDATRRVLRRAILEAVSGTRHIADIPRFIDAELILGATGNAD
jgi:hypothetical protein